MSSIELSAPWVTAMIPRLFRLNDGRLCSNTTNLSQSGLLNSAVAGDAYGIVGGYITLMKGTPPVDFASIPTRNSRISDLLCSFVVSNNAPGNFAPTQLANPTIINSIYVTPSAAGVASWFWWHTVQYFDTNANNVLNTAPLTQSIYGTVGLTGSGADLEMPDTNLKTDGTQYRIRNLRIQFPSTWTY